MYPNKRKEAHKKYHIEHRDEISKYYKSWYKKNGRKRAENYGDVIDKWAEENTEKVHAANMLQSAVASGKVIKPTKCCVCGNEGRVNGHHEDYNKPLEVVWLCNSCHKRVHNGSLKLELNSGKDTCNV